MAKKRARLKALEKRVDALEKLVGGQYGPSGPAQPVAAVSEVSPAHREIRFDITDDLYCRKTIMQGASLTISDHGDWTASVTVYNTSRHRKFKTWAYMYVVDFEGRRVGEEIVVELGNIGHHQTSTWTRTGENAGWSGAEYERVAGGRAWIRYGCYKR